MFEFVMTKLEAWQRLTCLICNFHLFVKHSMVLFIITYTIINICEHYVITHFVVVVVVVVLVYFVITVCLFIHYLLYF